MQANLVIYEPGAARPGTSLAFHIMAMQLVCMSIVYMLRSVIGIRILFIHSNSFIVY